MMTNKLGIFVIATALSACSSTPEIITESTKQSTFEIVYMNPITSEFLAGSSFLSPKIHVGVTESDNDIKATFTDNLKEGTELWIGPNETCYFKVYEVVVTEKENVNPSKELSVFSVDATQKMTVHDGDCKFERDGDTTSVIAKIKY